MTGSVDTWFAVSLAALVSATAIVVVRYLPAGRYRNGALALLAAWTAYAVAVAASGVLANPAARPPGLVFVVVPAAMLAVFAARSYAGAVVAASVPLWLLAGAQTVRLFVELFLTCLHDAGRLSSMMTFAGGNIDVLIGASAPIVAALLVIRRLDMRFALIWNALALVSLADVVVRGALASPAVHLIRTDVSNSAFGSYPFALVPAFVVPFALVLHVVAIRAIRGHLIDDAAARPVRRRARAFDSSPTVLDSAASKAAGGVRFGEHRS